MGVSRVLKGRGTGGCFEGREDDDGFPGKFGTLGGGAGGKSKQAPVSDKQTLH